MFCFGRSAHVRKPRAAHQPPRFRPAPPARSPLHRVQLRSRLLPEHGGSCAMRERARASGSQGQRGRVREAADQRM
jgi:hypothetical protein